LALVLAAGRHAAENPRPGAAREVIKWATGTWRPRKFSRPGPLKLSPRILPIGENLGRTMAGKGAIVGPEPGNDVPF